MQLKLMTFNVQHFENMNTKEIDLDGFAGFLRESGADVVGLNEVYLGSFSRFASLLGWYSYFARACEIGGQPYGNGLVSRFPIVRAETVPIPDPEPRGYDGYYETRALLACTVDADGVPLRIGCTHFGLNPDEAENAAAAALANTLPERFALMGDFNVLPEDPLLTPLRERLTDTATLLEGNTLSFPADAPDRRIDYIFLSRDLTPVSAEIPPLVLSDHRPYLCGVVLPDAEEAAR